MIGYVKLICLFLESHFPFCFENTGIPYDIFDLMKSYESESFISGVYHARGHDLPHLQGQTWTEFYKHLKLQFWIKKGSLGSLGVGHILGHDKLQKWTIQTHSFSENQTICESMEKISMSRFLSECPDRRTTSRIPVSYVTVT